MFSYLSGLLKGASPERVLLEVGGIGYKIDIPVSLYPKLPPVGSSLTLHVSFVIREFSQALYGFKNEEDRDLFEMLIDLSGVGPKIGLSVLGHSTSRALSGGPEPRD